MLQEKGTSRVSKAMLCKEPKANPLMLGLHSPDSKVFVTPLISISSVNISPFTLILAINILLLRALATYEKKLVFSSPSFSQSSLDFCTQEISSNAAHFLRSFTHPTLPPPSSNLPFLYCERPFPFLCIPNT